MPSQTDIRSRMAAASGRSGRVRRADRAAAAVITAGGALIIACVIGILVFIGLEAAPLFRPAKVRALDAVPLRAAIADAAGSDRLAVLGTDEHRRFLYTVEPDAHVVLWSYETGRREQAFALPGLVGAAIVSAARSETGDLIAAGTADGRVGLAHLRFRPVFEAQTQVGVAAELRDRGLVSLDPAGRPIEVVAVREGEGRTVVAGGVGGEIALWWRDDSGEARRAVLAPEAPERFTRIALGGVRTLAAGTASGRIYYWDLQGEPALAGVSVAARAPVTALAWLLGDHTLVAGAADGAVTAWFEVPPDAAGGQASYRLVHAFDPHGAPVTAIGVSGRGKSFVTGAADGSLVLRHLTSRRTLAALPGQAGAIRAVALTPKADGVVAALAGGRAARFEIDSPHPEVTLQTLFGRVWYEGYARPEFVWQSTGATDDFEPKLSLVPLLFGTIKGTVYALLFAIPLAVLGALYTSQFVHPDLRARIKPVVEIMAALPSVVIGFLAGLWLAGLVERHLVAVILGVPLVLAAGTSGAVLWVFLIRPGGTGPPWPAAWARRLAEGVRPGTEILMILPLLAAGAWVAALVGPWVEARLLGGDARLWLNAMGLTYDQRNCLVVGIAMGFAVIPIIFTIAEDAFSAVPSSLTAASLALGASRWQTAIRVVVPTASPGVFSAVMVGLGRAIGETMIVLMATGNTPIMDWSIFNGMRTLSANIAVEIPEAPVGGTLYRVLFLSAVLLFALTFVINTVAEIVRQRLRDRFKAV